MKEKFKLMIKRLVFVLALFFMCEILRAQEDYFQQEVNYQIEVKLNDRDHSLRAFESIVYTNHASKPLTEIWMHLWPNAYKNRTSALCKQKMDQKSDILYSSKPEERGYIDSLEFKVNGELVKWEADQQHADICRITLNQALLPQQTLTISTPFYVKIPDAKFSRLGHLGQSYCISQWYPKPAVYDKYGWHAMPYLDQGEFYSEFGSFDVSITLPKNYRLAATGDRVDAADEEEFLNKIEQETRDLIDKKVKIKSDSFPPSDSDYKTVRFRQNRVHDFAWFADKRFYTLHDQLELPVSGRVVDTWVFFTGRDFEAWSKALSYVNDAVLHYSRLLGEYPYKHVTAVDGTIMAGGGMEYPNITVIGSTGDDLTLDITITHEVGHNWLYGILGSNERRYPFMDEGLNSFYELRYARSKYPRFSMANWMHRDSTFHWLGLNKVPYWKEKELTYYMALKNRSDQPIDLPAEEYSPFNYGAVIYSKTALVFDYLMDYMGEEKFDKAMKYYYGQYRFKHPQPEDLFRCLSESSGMSMEAFEHYFIHTSSRFDYKIKSLKRLDNGSYNLKIKNKTGQPVPFVTQAFKFGKPIGLVWSNGFEGTSIIEFPPMDADHFIIDGENKLMDIQRRNNTIRVKGIFKKIEPIQLQAITSIDDERKTQLYYLPLAGVNFYNGFMLGMAVHNFSLYKKHLEFYIAPMYAFHTKNITGFGEFTFHFFPGRSFSRISAGLRLKSFSYDYFDSQTYNQSYGTDLNTIYCNYYRIKPFVEFELKKGRATSHLSQSIDLSSTLLFTDSLMYGPSGSGASKFMSPSSMNQINYRIKNNRLLDPFEGTLAIWQSGSLIKTSFTYVQKISFTPKYQAEIRVFAGGFLSGNEDARAYYAFRASGFNGYQDMLFDHNFIARNETNGLGFSQFAEEDGALKVWTPLGQSSSWLASINIKSPKLLKLPLKLYGDLVVCDPQFLNKDQFLWDAGITISLPKNTVEIYIPLIYCRDIRDALELNQVSGVNTIRFTLNIHKFAPGKLLPSVIQ